MSMENIYMKKEILRWDIEYWNSYCYSFEHGEIDGYNENSVIEYEHCRYKLQEAKEKHQIFIKENAEYFI